ncbi:MAG TPA: BLUF domain-containing protein [Bdellovibrio sp.]|nr:BLUF domain-containing protein [Bdellovibrio sp.]
MPKIFQLVYLSTAVEDISYTDIQDILEESRRHNAENNITGVLIFREGFFLQALEGTQAAVQSLVKKIKEDDRHFSLRVLAEGENDNRVFEKHPMVFLDGDIEANLTAELIDLCSSCFQAKPSQGTSILAMVRKLGDSASQFQ